jgi:hypothetical protein
MKTILACTVSALLVAGACNSKNPDYTPPVPEKKEVVLIPVTDFIRAQLNAVDSLPYGIFKVDTKDGKKDSSLLTKQDFRKMAEAEFLLPDFNAPASKDKYSEDGIFDSTVLKGSYTYTALDNSLEIRKVIVHVDPAKGDKITDIYMEKSGRSGDTSYLKRLTWYTDRSFQVVKLMQTGNQELTSVTKIIWNEPAD